MSKTLSEDRFWTFITSERILRRAAHLVDKDSKYDFHESHLERQIFSHSRDHIIREIIASLNSERYMPAPATAITIPKSAYSQRPGTLLPYRDRVVMQAIIMCLAPLLDECLSDAVWSWRVKPSLVGKTPDRVSSRGIFGESDLSEFPFLKKKTVSRYIDEFEPWYALWPKFDAATRTTLADEKYKFLVFSDIAGYFENIQLSLLQSLLLRYQPDAPNTINLMMRHLRAWCGLAYDGSQIERGIPQGNSVSSFLGNFFLKPIDDYFEENYNSESVRYFRYMDDIRIVAIDYETARRAALDLEFQIRRSKLNLQSAKTHVVTSKEAVKKIFDRRLNNLESVRTSINKGENREACLIALERIASDPGDSQGSVSIKNSRPPFDGLNLRVLSLWSSAHYQLKSSVPLDRICREALSNPSYKITRQILRIANTFPRNRSVPTRIWQYLTSGSALFPYQEAEFLRALRLFNNVPDSGYKHAYGRAVDPKADPYLRVQAVLLLCRTPEALPEAAALVDACLASSDLRVVMAGIVSASLDTHGMIPAHIRNASTHASHEAIRLIDYVRALRRERPARSGLLSFVFRDHSRLSHHVYDYAPFLRFVSSGSFEAAADLRAIILSSLKNKKGLSQECIKLLRFLLSQCEHTTSLSPQGAGVPSNDNDGE